MAIVITTMANGILFDLSAMSGAGTTRDKFVFRPSTFHTITKVSVRNDFMQYVTSDGEKYSFNFDGSLDAGSQVSQIDATTTFTDNYDLFDKFIAIL
jgi:hypothetical protein